MLIVDPVVGEFAGDVVVENGTIVDVIPREDANPDFILMPGFADTHTHGAIGVDALWLTEEKLESWEKFCLSEGVTFFLPTTVSAPTDRLLETVELVAQYVEGRKNTAVGGVHLEGPFVSLKRKGAQNPEFIRKPTEDEGKLLARFPVRLVTMAPEIEGFDTACTNFMRAGVKVSLGHTDASFATMRKAFHKGAIRIAHFPNGLTPIHHRNIASAGSAIYLDFFLEIIADGVHSVPEFVELVYRIKGAERIILITDSISAAGLEDGEYILGGLKVIVRDSKAHLEDGTIAGSTLTFSEALRNFRAFTGCSLRELAMVSSYNAFLTLGIGDRGRIAIGYRADLVVLDKNLRVVKTFLGGREVYSREV